MLAGYGGGLAKDDATVAQRYKIDADKKELYIYIRV